MIVTTVEPRRINTSLLRILKVEWMLGEPKSLGLNWNKRRDSYLDLNEKTCLQGIRPCNAQTGAFTNRNGPERTGTDRNGQEWTSITGMDFKIHPKIHVLSVLDKKFWLSNVKYQISSSPGSFNAIKMFSKIFSVLP